MKCHNRVLPKLASADHNSGIKLQSEVHTSLCIDVPLQASPCMHLAQLYSKINWGKAFIRHREEAVRSAWGGKSMCFWLNPAPSSLLLMYTHLSCEPYFDTSRKESELMLWSTEVWHYRRHIEYKYNQCRALKTCSVHHWGLISTESVVCVLLLWGEDFTEINNCKEPRYT